jgi:hypothetical protein
MLGQHDDPGIADSEGIERLERLAESGAMFARDFLKHRDVRVGGGEKSCHLVHVVVVVPQIEGDDAQETRTVRRGIRGTTRQTDADEQDIDGGKKAAGRANRQLRAAAVRSKTTMVPKAVNDRPSLTMSNRGHQRAKRPRAVKQAPSTRPATISPFSKHLIYKARIFDS